MVTIKRGQHEIVVSKSTYEKVFKKKGYRIIGEDKTKVEENREVEEPEKVETEIPVEEEDENDVDTIPVSDMNSEQLKEFAAKHNIVIPKVKNLGEAKRFVRSKLREQKVQ